MNIIHVSSVFWKSKIRYSVWCQTRQLSLFIFAKRPVLHDTVRRFILHFLYKISKKQDGKSIIMSKNNLFFQICIISRSSVNRKSKFIALQNSHHHHHIHFRALFSSTEGWAFWQVFLEGILSTQNDSEGQQNPYLASFCHSQALHPMISLACQIFSVQSHSACILLQSSLCCALHVQTTSSYWCGAPHLSPGCQALWEGSLS